MKLQFTLVAALVLLLLVSLWRPLYPREQWLQHVPTALAIPALAWGARKQVLSTGAFACLVPGDWEGFPRRHELTLLHTKEPVSR